jgi:hypothetical protein
MIAEVAVPSRSVPDAAQVVRDALDRVRMSQRRYAEVRRRARPAAVTRARTDWGLAVLEWIEASEELAAAEDGRGPGRAGGDGRDRRTTAAAGPVRDRVESAWAQYQQARRSGGPDQVAAARARWREALVDWFQALAGQRAAEDEQHARRHRAQEEHEATAETAGPGDPEPAEPGGPEAAGPGDPAAAGPREPEAAGEREAAGEPGPPAEPEVPVPLRPEAPAWAPGGRSRPAARRSPARQPPLGIGWTPAPRAPGS